MDRGEELKLQYLEKLIQSGEKDRLKEALRTQLIECGWRDKLKSYAKEIIQQRGLDHISVEELVEEIKPRGRGSFAHFEIPTPLFFRAPRLFPYFFGSLCIATVPDEIKAELLQRIRKFLSTLPT
ncbi:putative transcription and mRNA export factor ENY2 [Paratrimastix pyriformis]|uniref:Transcription and mRNA export factor ENY2 n=1 Tax=Paratrimastix pyriformis TaxID=342808 RepID=A0ABQ8UIB3_9EUKA|nr:putative transcription and mRNA export factor ENY2 [Paratrimastix pyriformis]